MDSEMTLEIKINNKTPVELLDLAQSMIALSDEYTRYIGASPDCGDPEQVKLYIKEVRAGSIIQHLVAAAPDALLYVGAFNSVVGFTEYLGRAISWFEINRKPPAWPEGAPSKKSMENLIEILEPVAKDPGSSLEVGAINVNGNGNVIHQYVISSKDSSAAQNNIRHAILEMTPSTTGERKNVVMYWSQARNDKQAKSGDKVVIESISRSAVKVVFSSDGLKKRMLFDVAHPFEKAFIVDVFVETITDKPVLYVVHEFHGLVER